jgi:hypothetical protein
MVQALNAPSGFRRLFTRSETCRSQPFGAGL